MRTFLWRAAPVVLAIGVLSGCEDTVPAKITDLGQSSDMETGGPDFATADQAAPIEFADFVLGLINTQTTDTSIPTLTEDKSFVDSMDPTKFTPLFP